MLRINLLPSYVPQRRLTRKLILGFAALLIVCVAVPLLTYLNDVKQKNDIYDKMTAAEAGKAKTDALNTQASNITAQIAPLQAKVDFVKAVHQHNLDIVNFWNTLAAYSSGSKVIYSDAAVSGNTLTLKAYSPSIAEIGRYLQAMYQEPDFTAVGVDHLPGFPEAELYKAYVGNQLVAIITEGGSSSGANGQPSSSPSSSPVSSGSASGGGNGAASGPKYGTAVTIGPGGTLSPIPVVNVAGTSANGESNQGGNNLRLAEQQLSTILINNPTFRQIYAAHFNPFGDPARSQMAAEQEIFKRLKLRTEPQGFSVTITATLKQPLVTPTIPGTAGASGPGGPGGPGMPSGPGMPGGRG